MTTYVHIATNAHNNIKTVSTTFKAMLQFYAKGHLIIPISAIIIKRLGVNIWELQHPHKPTWTIERWPLRKENK
jgi:hypothetical protein